MIIGDGGYNYDYQYFITPTGHHTRLDYMMAVVQARHETVNRRFKTWGILSQTFCHDINKRGDIFSAIINLEQLQIENGRPLFQLEFDINYY